MALSARSFLPLFVLTVAHGLEIKGPLNTISIVGSEVTLSCASSSGNCTDVDWQKMNPDANPSSVFKGASGLLGNYSRGRYSVNNSNGCHLVITDVQLADAGRFTCRVFYSSKSDEKDAYLIVLQSEPTCSTNASQGETAEGDGVQLTCKVKYDGSAHLANTFLQWEDVEQSMAAVRIGETLEQSYSFGASVPVIPSFICVVSFEVMRTKHIATNIPTTACKTQELKIFYSVRNVRLSPEISNYSPGVNITCTAEGWPSPSFKWQTLEIEMENGNNETWKDIVNETRSDLFVHNATSTWHRCVAMNSIRNQEHSAVSQQFQVNNTGLGSVFVILIVTIGLLALALLSIAAFYGVRRYKGSGSLTQTTASEKDTTGQGDAGYMNMETSKHKEESGYVGVQVPRPPSDTSFSSDFTP